MSYPALPTGQSSVPWAITRSDGVDMRLELEHFAAMIGLEALAAGRYSVLLLLQLYAGATSGRLNPAKVVSEISALEGTGDGSNMKPPSMFSRTAALRGLWHKHYLEDGVASMARNVRRGLRLHGLPRLKQMVADAVAAGEERYFTAADIPMIAREAVQENWERLRDQNALTGEWIIYAVHDGANYYLSLGWHTDDDIMLRQQTETFCQREFPFIVKQLEPLKT